jgi:N-acetylmuramic acid 6-phosphate etherase
MENTDHQPITEQDSHYDTLETKSTHDLLAGINAEDRKVATAVGEALPQIEALVEAAAVRMLDGGRLFYIGSGTSGRLGVVDASECPPTYGVPHDLVVGLIAGGDSAIRKAVEAAEDDPEQGWHDLQAHNISGQDVLIGLSASGSTPYVVGAVTNARSAGVLTGAVTCNPGTALAAAAEGPVEVITGPEFVTGSTRMKAGTAQKMVLNMLSTALMIKLGRVAGNRMVDMQLNNKKLRARGIRYIMQALGVSEAEAAERLEQYGSVRAALQA